MASTPGYNSTTAKASIPTGTAGTGTITASGADNVITGTGTLFRSQCQINGWIYVAASNEIVQVKSIESDTTIICTRNPVAFAGATFTSILPKLLYKSVSVISTGANGVISTPLNGSKTLPSGMPVNYEDNDGVGAFAVDATGGATIYIVTNR